MLKIRVINESKLRKVKRHPKMTAKRRDELFNDSDMRKLSRGIIPESEEDEELEEYNKYFDGETGHFTSKEKADCESTYFLSGDRRSTKGKLPADKKDDAGRGKKKSGSGRFRCSDGSVKYEGAKLSQNRKESNSGRTGRLQDVLVPKDTYDCAKQIINNKNIIKKLKRLVIQTKKSKQTKCPLSIQDAMRIINSLERASKGTLYDAPK